MPRSFVLFCLLLATACGERTSIQTGEVGKILGIHGLEKDLRSPGTFRMEWCGASACPKLVRLQTNKSTADLKIDTLFLPRSNVDIRNVQIGLQFQVKEDADSINTIFRDVRPVPAKDAGDESHRVLLITAGMVYSTYLERKAPDAIIMTLRDYTVDDILTKVPEIAEKAKTTVNDMLADAPIEITELGFPNGIGEPPSEVLTAKRKLFAVGEEKKRQLEALKAELEVESQRQAVQRIRVQNDALNAKDAGVPFQVYVSLKNQERMADAAEAMATAVAESNTPVIVQAPSPPVSTEE